MWNRVRKAFTFGRMIKSLEAETFVLGSQKRTSKSKKNMRKHVWKQKALFQAQKALFLAKYVLQNQTSASTEAEEVVQATSSEASDAS